MKVAHRVASGFVVLILLPVLLIAVQAMALRRLQAVNQSNSGENLRVALSVIQLVRDGDEIQRHARRYFSQGDTAAGEEMKSSISDYDSALQRIRESDATGREKEETDRLAAFWREFNQELSSQAQPVSGKAIAPELPAGLAQQFERLRAQSMTVYHSALQRINREAEAARQSGARSELIAWWICGAAIVLGAVLSFLIVRSISIPLQSLSEGTRGVVEGKSFYRLDTSRDDEFGQIAKDFNALSEKLQKREGTGEKQ